MAITDPQDLAGCLCDFADTESVYADLAKQVPCEDGDDIVIWGNRVSGGVDVVRSAFDNHHLRFFDDSRGNVACDFCRPGNDTTIRTMACVQPINRRSATVVWVGTLAGLLRRTTVWNLLSGECGIFCDQGRLGVLSGGVARYTAIRPRCLELIVIVATFSASGVTLYLDDARQREAVEAATEGTESLFRVGGNAGASVGWNCKRMAVYDRALSTAEVSDVIAWAKATYAVDPGRKPVHLILDCDGYHESLFATRNNSIPLYLDCRDRVRVWNFPRVGRTTSEAVDEFATTIDPYPFLADAWYFTLCTVNDLSADKTTETIIADTEAKIEQAVLSGIDRSRIVTATTSWAFSRREGVPLWDTRQDEVNDWKRSNVGTLYGRLIDWAADPLIGIDTDLTHPECYAQDGNPQNYGETGYQRCAYLLERAIPELGRVTTVR